MHASPQLALTSHRHLFWFKINILIASKRSLVQTICLLLQSDIDEFGLKVCLEEVLLELKNIVLEGIFDKKSNKNLQVRVIASLGDNLEQE